MWYRCETCGAKFRSRVRARWCLAHRQDGNRKVRNDYFARRRELAATAAQEAPPAGTFANVMAALEAGNENLFRPVPPAAPCLYPPGSSDKVAVLAARVEAGEDLFSGVDVSGYDGV